MNSDRVITVSELNRQVRLAIERSFPQTWIAGEISNFTCAPSGHWYFTLKDGQAAVRCAMFRNRNQFLDWQPVNGTQVEVRAQATLYEARGEFQLAVEAMRQAGLGALYEAFARLKQKLESEGLFDPSRKKALPRHPRCLGVVTSPKAAALRDVLSTLRHRWPGAQVILYPTPVQGAGAGDQIAEAIRLASTRQECDLLLVVRGGGSIEDLWAFNEEVVARAISTCTIPVVSGIGHETDFTIADFVADLRAPTPTGAAQLATPDAAEIHHRLQLLQKRLVHEYARRLNSLSQQLDALAGRLRHPAERLKMRRQDVEHAQRRLQQAMALQVQTARQQHALLAARLHAARPMPDRHQSHLAMLARRLHLSLAAGLQQRTSRLSALQTHLLHLNPEAVLNRGYSIVRTPSGDIVRDAGLLGVGKAIEITLAKGQVEAQVTAVRCQTDGPS